MGKLPILFLNLEGEIRQISAYFIVLSGMVGRYNKLKNKKFPKMLFIPKIVYL
jgi:hypothetical protein